RALARSLRSCWATDPPDQLAAGGADVASLAPADGRGDAAGEERFQELGRALHRRRPEAFDPRLVVGDQIDLGAQPPEPAGDPFGVARSIVHALQEHVLKGDLLPWPERKAAAGLHETVEAVLAVDRHQIVAQGVARSEEHTSE